MAGFGSGPFGSGPFGQAAWARRVLYESLPETYRRFDEQDGGGKLRAWTEALVPQFDGVRIKIRDFGDLRDPLKARTQYNDTETLILDSVRVVKGSIEQRGTDAQVLADRTFYASNGRFTPQDIGKILVVSDSAIQANNVEAVVASVVGPTVVLTDPLLTEDAGPLKWEMRPVVSEQTGELEVAVRSGDVSRVTPGWILSDGQTEFEIVRRIQFDRPDVEVKKLIETSGEDGAVDSYGFFNASSYMFKGADVGRTLSARLDEVTERFVRIRQVVITGATTSKVLTEPALDENAGPITWALLPLPRLVLKTKSPPKGVVEQSGSDLAVNSSGAESTVVSSKARFSSGDVGKFLLIQQADSPFDVVVVPIVSVVSEAEAQVQGTLPVSIEPSFWQLRSGTQIPRLSWCDAPTVKVHAPSMLAYLARDFGTEVDPQESEDRQRSWVANVQQWIGLKGTATGYLMLGNISGFDTEVVKLYRVDPQLAGITGSRMFDVPDPNRYGVDGTLTLHTDGRVKFTTTTGLFTRSDVGRQIRIRGAVNSLNNRLFTIEEVLTGRSVAFRFGDTAIIPEAASGSLSWWVVRTYTDRRPVMPNFDEFNSDLMEDLVGIDGCCPDQFCWEETTVSSITATVADVTPSGFQPFPRQIQVTATDNFLEVITYVGSWFLVDVNGQSFPVESLPVDIGGGLYTFTVTAAVPPALGACTLRYVCPEQTSFCGFCSSYRALLTLTTTDALIGEGGEAVQNLFDRVKARMRQVTPAHVEIVYKSVGTLTAALSLSATVEPVTV